MQPPPPCLSAPSDIDMIVQPNGSLCRMLTSKKIPEQAFALMIFAATAIGEGGNVRVVHTVYIFF